MSCIFTKIKNIFFNNHCDDDTTTDIISNPEVKNETTLQDTAPETADSNTNGTGNQNDQPTISEQFDLLSKEMLDILTIQNNLQISIESLKQSTIALGKSVRSANMYTGLCMLCDLWRKMKIGQDDLSVIYSDSILEILESFGVKAILPTAGDTYNPLVHEYDRSPVDSYGSIISGCAEYNCGWEYNGEVLKKAIVESSEKEVDENV